MKKFPSPIGELHFSIFYQLCLSLVYICFRPLSGSYISQQYHAYNLALTFVSVPYRGATFLNNVYTLCRFAIYRFPSPIGELHFSIKYQRRWQQNRMVSVPYRGATFLNILTATESEIINNGFRPLSGSYISQLNMVNMYGLNLHMFPSPIGELHFSICRCSSCSISKYGFRPLSGSYISQ